MKKILINIKDYLFFLAYLILSTLFISILNYFTNLSMSTIKIISFSALLLGFIILSFKQGKKSKIKGYLCGLKTGGIVCLILFIFTLIFYSSSIRIKTFIYYAILILCSIMGSIIGVNKKADS